MRQAEEALLVCEIINAAVATTHAGRYSLAR